MKNENITNKYISNLIKTGSSIKELMVIKSELNDALSKVSTGNINKVINDIEETFLNETNLFLTNKNKYGDNYISGISSSIYIDDNISINIIGGHTHFDRKRKIDEATLFDVASITKLFTLILAFKLSETGFLNLSEVIEDTLPEYNRLNRFTIMDLLLQVGVPFTDGNVATAKDIKSAKEIMKTLHWIDEDKTKNTYTCFGSIVLSEFIEKKVNSKLNSAYSYDEILEMFILKPTGLYNTKFNPKAEVVAGNKTKDLFPHDPKARNLGGIVGSAGLFTNSRDLQILSKSLFDGTLLSKESIKKIGTRPFSNEKGLLGIFQKDSAGLLKTEVSSLFANNSFAMRGYTGAYAAFDAINKIHTNVLTSTLREGVTKENEHFVREKPYGYAEQISDYQFMMAKISIILKGINLYFEANNEELILRKTLKI